MELSYTRPSGLLSFDANHAALGTYLGAYATLMFILAFFLVLTAKQLGANAGTRQVGAAAARLRLRWWMLLLLINFAALPPAFFFVAKLALFFAVSSQGVLVVLAGFLLYVLVGWVVYYSLIRTFLAASQSPRVGQHGHLGLTVEQAMGVALVLLVLGLLVFMLDDFLLCSRWLLG